MATYVELLDIVLEASHGKLKYDFRSGFDIDSGHAVKIIYSLNNIKVDDIGEGYQKSKRNTKTKEENINDIQKNISKKGNMDHVSHGQKILAIVDRVTGKKLQSANVIGPYAPSVDSGSLKLRNSVKEYYDSKDKDFKNRYIQSLKVGDVDNSKSFKTTHWCKKDTSEKKLRNGNVYKADNSNMRRQSMESLKYGRGSKLNDIKPSFIVGSEPTYNHPSKRDIKRNPNAYLKESVDFIKLDIYESWYSGEISLEERDLLLQNF